MVHNTPPPIPPTHPHHSLAPPWDWINESGPGVCITIIWIKGFKVHLPPPPYNPPLPQVVHNGIL
jgi:hypothetical protein